MAFVSVCVVRAQGMLVQPVSYEISVKPGGNYELPFELRNNQPDAVDQVEMNCIYLTQDLAGFEGVEADKITPEILKQFPTCLPWIKLPSETKFTIPALSQASQTVHINVPGGARGFYGAVITVVSHKPRQGPGIAVSLRFVIPILLHVESGISRKGGQVQGIVGAFAPADKTHPAGTQVSCLIKNTGDALARYSGTANVFQMIGGRMRRVITAVYDERRIVPNATVALSYISPNRLPSGKYHVETSMTMEGQKLPPFVQDIVVKGDPTVTTATADVELGLSPDPLNFDAITGATRSLAFKVNNTSTEPIVVDAFVTTPKSMVGAVGAVGTGEDLSLARWCSEPLTGIEVKSGQERTMRMVAVIPDVQLKFPSYYGELHVVAKTQSGAFVGESSILMSAKNKTAVPVFSVTSNEEIVVASVKPKIYGFTSNFSNIGNSAIEPQVEARVTDTARLTTFTALEVANVPKRVLPFQTFRPSGQIDLALLKDGTYILEITIKAGNIGELATIGFRVKTEGKVKTLSIIKLPKGGSKTSLNPPVPPSSTGPNLPSAPTVKH